MQDSSVFTDTHTHIYYSLDSGNLSQQIDEAIKAGVDRFFLPNVDLDSIKQVSETVHHYPDRCFPMMGLHPCSIKADYLEQLAQMEIQLSNQTVYAIGEIGIDLYWDKTTLPWQQDAFRKQISWAKSLGLPIDIHCREAFDEIFEILEAEHDEFLFGILHCFTGTIEQANRAIDLGFKLGIGGVVTFKNAGLDKVVEQLDLRDIVLETDAPYLSPAPYRGKPNKSSYLPIIAQKVADLHHTSIEEVARITTDNSKSIFKI